MCKRGLISILLLLAVPASGQLKVYISADMEGVTGVVTEQQLGPSGFEYGQFRQYMTDEVLAASRGLAGAMAGIEMETLAEHERMANRGW